MSRPFARTAPRGRARSPPNREKAANKFDRQQNEGRRRQLAADDRLDVRNPAARRMLAETPHEPRAYGCCRRRAPDQEAAAEEWLVLPPLRKRVAGTIGLFQRQPE
jgi:hypothetical protein